MSLFMLVCYFVSPFLNPARCPSRGVHSSTSLHSAPLDPIPPIDSYTPESESKSVSAFAALFLPPSKSMPACSHHRQDTLAPGRRLDCSQRSRIGHIAIYCATVFCLLIMDFLIPSKPASPIASSNGG